MVQKTIGTVTTLLRSRKGGDWRFLSRGSVWCVAASKDLSDLTWITAAHVVHPHKFLGHFPEQHRWLSLVEDRDVASLLEFRDPNSGRVLTGGAFCPSTVRCCSTHDLATLQLLNNGSALQRIRNEGVIIKPLAFPDINNLTPSDDEKIDNSLVGEGVTCWGHRENNLDNSFVPSENKSTEDEEHFFPLGIDGEIISHSNMPLQLNRIDTKKELHGNVVHISTTENVSIGFSGGPVISMKTDKVIGIIQSGTVTNNSHQSKGVVRAISYKDAYKFVYNMSS